MRPWLAHIKNWLSAKRVLGNDEKLLGLVGADQVLGQLVHNKRVPGLAITVLRNGEIFFQKGYGYADLETQKPVDPKKTIFRVASISKNIAATALAQMVSAGQMHLDASLYAYVPYFPKKKWDFTIRQLAAHTAGIRGYRGKEYGLNKPYTIKEGIAIFKDDPLVFEPGTDYLYTSFDWVLLSLAMQEAANMPFEDYVRQNVLLPLEMYHTFSPNDIKNEPPSTLSTFYSKGRTGFREAIPVHNQYKLAGGGYLSTAADIARFGRAVLERNPWEDPILRPFLTEQQVQGRSTYYGLGWQVSHDARGRPFYGHVGNGVGGYSNLFIYPNEQTVVAMLANCTDPKIQEDLDQAVDLLLKTDGQAPMV